MAMSFGCLLGLPQNKIGCYGKGKTEGVMMYDMVATRLAVERKYWFWLHGQNLTPCFTETVDTEQ